MSDPGKSIPIDELNARKRWLSAVIYARVRDWSAVEDVFQEVALALFKAPDRFPKNGAVSAWLYRVAVRKSLMHLRSEGRQKKHIARFAESREPINKETAASFDPMIRLESLEESQQVRTAMNQLRTRDREILFLKYSNDWNCKTIATHLGVSESTVKTRLLRARKRLRECLQAMDVGPEQQNF